jgi:hypothetical protein
MKGTVICDNRRESWCYNGARTVMFTGPLEPAKIVVFNWVKMYSWVISPTNVAICRG